MRIGAGSFKLCLLLALGIVAAPARAELLTARIAAVKTGAGTLRDVTVTLDWPRGATQGRLSLQAAKLEFPALSYSATQVAWQCPLRREGADTWRCAGGVRVKGGAPSQLAVVFAAEGTQAVLATGKRRLAYSTRSSLPDRHDLRLEKIPVAWLSAFLKGLWAEGRWTGGELDGSVTVKTPEAAPFEVATDLRVSGLGLETPDGLLAAADLKGSLQVDYRDQAGRRSVDTHLVVTGGELLFDSLYVKFPSSPVDIRVDARQQGKAPWTLPRIAWKDPGVLDANGSASFDAQSSLSDLGLALDFPDLGLASERYLSGFLAPAGFSGLVLDGGLKADLQMRDGALSLLHARLRKVNAVDPKARFTLAGIDGDLQWTRAAGAVDSRVGWQGGALFGIGLGAADFRFSSSGGELRLARPVPIAALEGKVVLEDLRWQAPAGETGARFQFGLGMEALDLASLSQRLGWPAFTGTLAGRIPSARFQDDVLTIDGGVRMDLFGGNVQLDALSMERPFGVAPTLSGDVRIQDIDLEPMTKVFGFGAITGRLDGRIDGLRLVDWTPVAFDARLETDREWKGKRRISQRAVNDISSVGGSGLAGGLQTQVLKLFDDFGYARIGLGCKLRDNVCTMEGIGSAGDGYIIVEGAGLPRIQVVGFRRRVDWPTLVSRLQAATQGQAPIIQ